MIARVFGKMLAMGLLGGVAGFILGGWAAPTRESEAKRITEMVRRDPVAAINQMIDESNKGEAGKSFEEIAMDYRRNGALVGAPIGLLVGLVMALGRGKRPMGPASSEKPHS
jgi:hypothetical protein